MEKKDFPKEGIWKIRDYGIQHGKNRWSTWKTEKEKSIFLILRNMNLMILYDDTLLDNFSFLQNDVRRIIHNKDTMAIAIVQEKILARNVRFRFAGTAFFSAEAVCNNCANILGNYVSVTYNGDADISKEASYRNRVVSLTQSIADTLKLAIEDSCSDKKLLTSSSLIEEVFEDCILSAEFSEMVLQVKKYFSSK